MAATAEAVLARLEALETEAGVMKAELAAALKDAREAREETARVSAEATERGKGGGGKGKEMRPVDHRVLQKIELFEGHEATWKDWPIVFKAAATAAMPLMGDLFARAETSGATPLMNCDLKLNSLDEEFASQQLHYLLILICRSTALDIVVNSGSSEGAEAWRKLHNQFGSIDDAGYTGQLVQLLSFDFTGDIQQRLESFEREITRYQKSGEKLSDATRIGVVLKNLPGGPLRDHLILNARGLKKWLDFRAEVTSIRRTQAGAGGGGNL